MQSFLTKNHLVPVEHTKSWSHRNSNIYSVDQRSENSTTHLIRVDAKEYLQRV